MGAGAGARAGAGEHTLYFAIGGETLYRHSVQVLPGPFDAASSSVGLAAATAVGPFDLVVAPRDKALNALPKTLGAALSAFLRPVGDANGGALAAGDARRAVRAAAPEWDATRSRFVLSLNVTAAGFYAVEVRPARYRPPRH